VLLPLCQRPAVFSGRFFALSCILLTLLIASLFTPCFAIIYAKLLLGGLIGAWQFRIEKNEDISVNFFCNYRYH
jgi:hypothetical protein